MTPLGFVSMFVQHWYEFRPFNVRQNLKKACFDHILSKMWIFAARNPLVMCLWSHARAVLRLLVACELACAISDILITPGPGCGGRD